MANINNIPVFEGTIDNDSENGMIRISLVDCPAVMTDFLAFKNIEKKPMQFSIEDEEKHLVLGVVMRADFPIYRFDKNYGEYYMIFKKETIRAMAEKYLADGFQNRIDLDHDSKEVEGVNMVQWFIKDSEKGICPKDFDNIAEGSLFAEFKVEDEEIWESIKEGTYNGFSLEGYFNLEKEDNQDYVNYAVKKTNGKFTMNKSLKKIKDAFGNLVGEKFANLTTDKGILRYDGEELTEGIAVVLVDEEGNETTPEDGEYIAEDKKIKIVDGKVSSIEEVSNDNQEENENEQLMARKENFTKLREKVCQFGQSFNEKYRAINIAFQSLLGDYFYIQDAGDDFAVIEKFDSDYNSLGTLRYAVSFAEDGTCSINDEGKQCRLAYVPLDMEIDFSKVQKMAEEGAITREEFDALVKKVDDYIESNNKENDELYKIVDGILKEIGSTRDAVEEMKKQSAGKDIHEESLKAEVKEETKLEKASKFMSALRNNR